MRFRRRPSLSLVAAALLALGAGPSLTGSPLFRVSRISIEGLRLLDAEEISSLSGIAPGANLYEMDMREAVARIQAHPMVRSARIVRIPPDGVLISVTERAPLALINLETLCAVDEGGALIPFHPTFVDLPVITGVTLKNYALGQPVPDRVAERDPAGSSGEEGLQRCLRLLKEVRKASPEFWDQISEVRPAPDRVVLNLVGDGLEVWMSAEDAAAQAEKFLAFQAGVKGAAGTDYLDLRFDGQVVVGPPKARPGEEGKARDRKAPRTAGREVPSGRRRTE
jgi:cell division protein FtsQ